MQKYFATSIFAALILFWFSPAKAQEFKLRVGFIGGLSGPGKAYGEACKNGFELGQQDSEVSLLTVVYEDDQFQPARTVAAFKKLVEIDRVDLVLTIGSSMSKAVAPLAEQQQIPLIAWASDTQVAAGRKFIFRSWVSGEQEGAYQAAEATRDGLKRLAYLTATSDYTSSVWKGFKSAYQGEVALRDEYPADAQDFKPFLLQMRSRQVTTLGTCLNPGQIGLAAKQAVELGLSLNYFGCENMHDLTELKTSNGALAGAWFVTGNVADWFAAAYRARYGNDDVISGAAIYYDLAKLLSGLTAEHPGRRGAELAQALRAAGTHSGAMGRYTVKVKDGDQFFDVELVVKQITKDGFRVKAR